MKTLVDQARLLGAGLAISLAAAAPVGATLVTNLEDDTNGGGFFANVTVDDVAGGVAFSLSIKDPINLGLTQGDILGLWLEVDDESLLPAMAAAYSNNMLFSAGQPMGIISDAEFVANGVGSLGGNVNLNGSSMPNGWDIGIALGSNGGPDFNQVISFNMLLPGLSESTFDGGNIGMRVQSIEGGAFDSIGSSKLTSTGSTTPPPPPPPPTGVPAPLPLALLGIGLIGLGLIRRTI